MAREMLRPWTEGSCEVCGVLFYLTRTGGRPRKDVELCGECAVHAKRDAEVEALRAELARVTAERDAANQREIAAVLVIMSGLGVSCDAARETAKSKLYDWNGGTPYTLLDAVEAGAKQARKEVEAMRAACVECESAANEFEPWDDGARRACDRILDALKKARGE